MATMAQEPSRNPPPPPRPGPALPPDYVSLAQLREQRRLKLERQRLEEEAAARLREQREEEERLRRLKEEEEKAAPRQGGSGAARAPARGGGRRGRSRWRRRKGGDGGLGANPEAKSEGAGEDARVGGGEGPEDGGREKGNGGPRGGRAPGRRNRSRKARGARAGAAAAAAAGGEENSRYRSETKGREEVKPRPVVVEKEEKEGRRRPRAGGDRVPELELEERPGNAHLALARGGQEGARVTRHGLQRRARKVEQGGKFPNPLGPNETVDVASKLKDMSISMPKGDEAGLGHPRPTVGSKGGRPSFRANGALDPRCRSRAAAGAGDGMVWVRKTEKVDSS